VTVTDFVWNDNHHFSFQVDNTWRGLYSQIFRFYKPFNYLRSLWWYELIFFFKWEPAFLYLLKNVQEKRVILIGKKEFCITTGVWMAFLKWYKIWGRYLKNESLGIFKIRIRINVILKKKVGVSMLSESPCTVLFSFFS